MTQRSRNETTRRGFLKTSAGAAAAGVTSPFWFNTISTAAPNEKLTTAAIGLGGQGVGKSYAAAKYAGPIMACCDVDSIRAGIFAAGITRRKLGRPKIYEDYRNLLERKDIDAVVIGTPDHWHTAMAVDALQTGKDVYCEKPLTLTIDEGKMLCRAVKETGRIFQVGTQQRTTYDQRFLKAIVMAQSGRLGKIKRVQAAISGAPSGGPFKAQQPPAHLNWDFWLGQAPKVPYMKERCHYKFRWWFEYSGGKMTDIGAHHVDIAQWAIGKEHSGPDTIEPLHAEFPNIENGYNTATKFKIRCMFGDVEMIIRHDTDDGVLIEGAAGRIFVNRRRLTGKPIEQLTAKDKQWLDAEVEKLYRGPVPKNHVLNFAQSVRSRKQPISDVFTHHRILTTCHLANIAIRLGRPLKWDPVKEQIVGDNEANGWLKRTQRKGYEFGHSA